jgi:hypothetical protein
VPNSGEGAHHHDMLGLRLQLEKAIAAATGTQRITPGAYQTPMGAVQCKSLRAVPRARHVPGDDMLRTRDLRQAGRAPHSNQDVVGRDGFPGNDDAVRTCEGCVFGVCVWGGGVGGGRREGWAQEPRSLHAHAGKRNRTYAHR